MTVLKSNSKSWQKKMVNFAYMITGHSELVIWDSNWMGGKRHFFTTSFMAPNFVNFFLSFSQFSVKFWQKYILFCLGLSKIWGNKRKKIQKFWAYVVSKNFLFQLQKKIILTTIFCYCNNLKQFLLNSTEKKVKI